MDDEGSRIERQLGFVLELDRLKRVERRTWLLDQSRHENSAEHSWHLALMALVLAEHADQPLSLERVLRLLLVHDVVEIDAGDTFAYDAAGNADRVEREQRAAERLFGLLPEEQARELMALWREFEERSSVEARFAAALDRLQPVLHNLATEGRAWREHGVRYSQVVARNQEIGDGAPALWRHARALLDAALRDGRLLG